MSGRGPAAARQRGWFGTIAILVAVLIVAVLAGTVLKQIGGTKGPGTQGGAARGPAAGAAAPDVESVAPAPRNAMERARALEDTVRQQAVDLNRRIDDAGK